MFFVRDCVFYDRFFCGVISNLFQDMAGGPEVQTTDGEWIYADYKPGNVNAQFLLDYLK